MISSRCGLTAKQVPRWPGIVSALGLRAGLMFLPL
jgi:hypothetical protein